MQLSTFYIAIFAIICLFASYTTAAFADKKWLTDLDEAKQIAAQEQKPILVQFTKSMLIYVLSIISVVFFTKL